MDYNSPVLRDNCGFDSCRGHKLSEAKDVYTEKANFFAFVSNRKTEPCRECVKRQASPGRRCLVSKE